MRGRAEPWVPPGHFYSPIVDIGRLEAKRSRVFDRTRMPAGIDLNVAGQMAFLKELEAHMRIGLPFKKIPDLRFFLDNQAFNCADAYCLAALLLQVRPRRVVEIGSGYSSALMLDVSERHLAPHPSVTFIEPHPALLRSLLRPADLVAHRLVESPIEDCDPSIVDSLAANDVLFIDSTHVAKTGSDVLFELFELLPRLKHGVLVHFHDIFYPFEYPEAWLFEENRSWNEAYLLRALLTQNSRYQILLWPHYLMLHHTEAMRRALPDECPLWGSSIWLRVNAEGAIA